MSGHLFVVFVVSVVLLLCGGAATGALTCTPTARDESGPWYEPNLPVPVQQSGPEIPSLCVNSPAHNRLFLNGTIRLLTGNSSCGIRQKAFLDLWQADANGDYSNTTCRTRIYTGDDGSYSLSTIFPGRYNEGGFRPAHIHFAIIPVNKFNEPVWPAGKKFITQLYFAKDPYKSPRDSCHECRSSEPSLIIPVENVSDVKTFLGSWNVLLPIT